ncbi:MAG TPA: 4Fe-4S dicluster domain-containing protein [Syntrophomonadaceae bacterium]|nr:4Fe-4S dicluster domain-containing protein [Syntrophomonadaceae bacterium]
MRVISIDREKCTGCGICQVACSLTKTGAVQPSLGRIKVISDKRSRLQMVSVCQHCAEPACQTACLMEGISKDLASGQIIRDLEMCFGCGACQVACPISAPILDVDQGVIVTCDLCDGNPVCVKVCPHGAIAYGELTEAITNRRIRQGARFFGVRQEGVE